MPLAPPEAGYVLVVDDDPSGNEILSMWLRKHGHRVLSAFDASTALVAIARESVELVLLDVMLPGADGLSVLRALRRDPATARTPVIMVTALGESPHIVEALTLGANDYVTKPLDFAVVMARVERHLATSRASAELAAEHERVRRDLEAAGDIQRAFLPREAPAIPALRVAWTFRPCAEVGGDFFNLFATESGRVAFYMLDVSGHGVQAAVTAVGLGRLLVPTPAEASLLRDPSHGQHHPFCPPAEVATRLNRHFCATPSPTQYATFFYGVLDPQRRDVRYTSAGHPWPVRVPACGRASFVETEGFPIGWVQEPGYEDSVLQLEAGDRLYVCSDGLSEATNAAGRLFGLRRLLVQLEELRQEPLDQSVRDLVAGLERWHGGREMEDDISVLALELGEA